ncbi:hypothetical protein Mapa_008479 [Marchantia paleacea]|nr:hypothetical protein Mapa_008479 [Marchantia paleacea]
MGTPYILLFLTLLQFSGGQGELFRIPKNETAQAEDSNVRLYIIYMGQARGTIQRTQILLQGRLLSRVIGSSRAAQQSLVYNYVNGFSGFAAMLTPEQAEKMRSQPGVVSVFLSQSYKVQTTSSWAYLGFETSTGIWPAAKFGENSIVGMLDTGIWPESESFNDDGMSPVPETWKGECVTAPEFGPENCNRKLIGAKFYVKGYESVYGPVTGEGVYRSPRDSEGHGTHTSSTAVGKRVANTSLLGLAKGTATGGAPSARLAMYKVCWTNDCNSADILAAFDDAIKDGVNILSLSLGGFPADYQEDTIAIGGFHATARGILVSTSGGNSGPYRGTVSNLAPWILTVAASTINRQFLAKVILGDGKTFEGATINTYTMNSKKLYPIVYGGDIPAKDYTQEEASYCESESLDKAAVKGKIVVCQSGGGASDLYIYEAGGVGLIVIDEFYKQIAFTYSIPASSVDQASGDIILNYINHTKSPTARIEKTDTVFGAAPAPVAAIFSSRGPNTVTPDILKPDITGPGVDILAAWSPVASLTGNYNDDRSVGYNIISGTSMSCPHITGSAALLKTLHPDWSPAAIKSALMTTATPLDESINDGDLGLSVGSGQINPKSFADPGLVYDATSADYANFLCSIGYTTKQLRLVTGDKSVCPEEPPSVLDLNYPSIFVSTNRTGTQTLIRTVTNVGPVVSTYTVSVVQPVGVKITVTPSVLSFDSDTKYRTFKVSLKIDMDDDSAYVFGTITWSDGDRSVRMPVGVGPPLF